MKRVLVAVLLGLASGCSDGDQEPKTVTVFAAASLSKAFPALADRFEAEHDGVRVRFSFAGSQSLVEQIQQGAPADVLATADEETIDKVRGELSADPVVFAHNQLAIVTAPGNPLRLTTLADLAKPGVTGVLAGPKVPVGKAAAAALARAGVTVRPISLEDAVSGVVTKVGLDEADAGIAYVTDLGGADVGGVPVDGTRTDLAIGVLDDDEGFVDFVRGADGQRILRSFGFS